MGCQLGKVAGRPPAFAQRLAPQPGDDPDHVHGSRRQERLEVCARQPQVPTPAEIEAPDPLREAALHHRPQGVLRCELGRLLAVASGLVRLMVRLQPDGERILSQILGESTVRSVRLEVRQPGHRIVRPV